MDVVRGWLMTIIAASLLCALADALMPRGAVCRVGRLVCGLVMLSALLSPLGSLDVEAGQRWLEEYLISGDSRKLELEETVNNQMKVIIEQECAAYIVDKAAELGLNCTARVECGALEDGLYLPIRAEVTGAIMANAQEKLIRSIEEELGIPREAQIYVVEEEMP